MSRLSIRFKIILAISVISIIFAGIYIMIQAVSEMQIIEFYVRFGVGILILILISSLATIWQISSVHRFMIQVKKGDKDIDPDLALRARTQAVSFPFKIFILISILGLIMGIIAIFILFRRYISPGISPSGLISSITFEIVIIITLALFVSLLARRILLPVMELTAPYGIAEKGFRVSLRFKLILSIFCLIFIIIFSFYSISLPQIHYFHRDTTLKFGMSVINNVLKYYQTIEGSEGKIREEKLRDYLKEENLEFGEGGYMTLLDRRGKLVRGDKSISFNLVGKSGIFTSNDDKTWVIYQLLPNSSDRYLAIVYPPKELAENRRKMATMLGILTLIMLIIATSLSILITDDISIPLRKLINTADAISKGELRQKALVLTNDEVGDLASELDEMRMNLNNLVIAMINTSNDVAATAEELSASSQQVSASIEQVSSSIQQMAEGANLQSEQISSIMSTSETVSEATTEVTSAAQEAEGRGEQMAISASEGRESSEDAARRIDEISIATADMVGVVSELREASQRIGLIVEAIGDIARQTNMLSFNASIEASHARDYGRGFAVVAEQIRNLSLQTRESIEDIRTLVEGVQQSTKNTIESIGRVAGEMNKGRGVVDSAGEKLYQIADSIEASASLMQSIFKAVASQRQQINNLVDAIRGVAAIAEENAASSEEIIAAVQEQTASIQEMTSSSQSLANLAEKMRDLIGRFKVDEKG